MNESKKLDCPTFEEIYEVAKPESPELARTFMSKRIEQYLTLTAPVARFLEASSVRVEEFSATEAPSRLLTAVLTRIGTETPSDELP